MSKFRVSDDKPNFLDVRSSKDYYKISNFFNYNTDLVLPQKVSDANGKITQVEISGLSDTSLFSFHDCNYIKQTFLPLVCGKTSTIYDYYRRKE